VGDATEADTLDALMQGEQADLLLTDPPYGVSYVGKTADALTIENDTLGGGALQEFLVDAFNAANSAMRPGAAFYVWHADTEGLTFRTACREVGWDLRQCLVWAKDCMVMGRQDYHWKHEPCLYGWKGGAAHQWLADHRQTTLQRSKARWKLNPVEDGYAITVDGDTYVVTGDNLRVRRVDTTMIEVDRPKASRDHPTMKPVALFEYLVLNSAKRGEVVLDPFAGSGTTVIACERTGRKARVVELDPKYADVVRRRWAEYVGGEGCDWVAATPKVEHEAVAL
jgi:site-specific DNA-methyltransferase (adenine-specific)